MKVGVYTLPIVEFYLLVAMGSPFDVKETAGGPYVLLIVASIFARNVYCFVLALNRMKIPCKKKLVLN